jgi:integrase
MKGHLRERSPGHWAIVIDVRDSQTGKRKRRWHSFAGTKREAQIECSRLITEAAGGICVDPSRMTVAAYLNHWLDHMRAHISPRSLECYRELAANILPWIGAIVISKLRPAEIAGMYAHALETGRRDRSGGLSSRTVYHMHVLLKSALAQAVKWEMLSRNPADVVKPPKVERRQMRVLDAEGAIALIEAARPRALFMPILLSVLCGLRRGEVAGLRWRDVDLNLGRLSVVASIEQTNDSVRLKPPKSGRSRAVALPALAIEELRRHRLKQAEELLRLGIRQSSETHVCLQPNYQPWAPRNLSGTFVRFIKASGLPRVRLHDLRHSHATHLLAANVHPKIVQERLGHANIGITMDIYSHVMPGMQDEAAGRVDVALRAALAKHRDTKG